MACCSGELAEADVRVIPTQLQLVSLASVGWHAARLFTLPYPTLPCPRPSFLAQGCFRTYTTWCRQCNCVHCFPGAPPYLSSPCLRHDTWPGCGLVACAALAAATCELGCGVVPSQYWLCQCPVVVHTLSFWSVMFHRTLSQGASPHASLLCIKIHVPSPPSPNLSTGPSPTLCAATIHPSFQAVWEGEKEAVNMDNSIWRPAGCQNCTVSMAKPATVQPCMVEACVFSFLSVVVCTGHVQWALVSMHLLIVWLISNQCDPSGVVLLHVCFAFLFSMVGMVGFFWGGGGCLGEGYNEECWVQILFSAEKNWLYKTPVLACIHIHASIPSKVLDVWLHRQHTYPMKLKLVYCFSYPLCKICLLKCLNMQTVDLVMHHTFKWTVY